jgi:histidinol-phosphate phosphatase family protein
MYPAIFLDRDGVLIENRSEYVRDWSHVTVIPEAIRALALPQLSNYKVVIVTNQSAVGRGLMLLETAEQINRRLLDLIHAQGGEVHAVYMCPHKPGDGCSCRKPSPGLLFQAAKDLVLDLKRSWMIGDAWSDVQAGQLAGVRQAVLLKTGRGLEQLALAPPAGIAEHLIFENLSAAFHAIFAVDNSETTEVRS